MKNELQVNGSKMQQAQQSVLTQLIKLNQEMLRTDHFESFLQIDKQLADLIQESSRMPVQQQKGPIKEYMRQLEALSNDKKHHLQRVTIGKEKVQNLV